MDKFKKYFYLFFIFLGAIAVTAVLVFIYPRFFIFREGENKEGEKILENIEKNSVYFPEQDLYIKVEIARDPYAWAKGLMFRENLPESEGMLFIFPNEGARSFWMKNTLIPLDLIFISKDGKVVDIKENFEPCKNLTCPSYSSKEPAMYVLEVKRGVVEKFKILVGDSVVFRGF